MKASVKKTIKFAAGVCAALGVVTIGAVVASGAAVKVVTEGLKAAKDTMKQTIVEIRAEEKEQTISEEIPAANYENSASEITSEDFEETSEVSEN